MDEDKACICNFIAEVAVDVAWKVINSREAVKDLEVLHKIAREVAERAYADVVSKRKLLKALHKVLE